MGKARHRVHDEQHRLALIAKILGHRHRRFRREAAHHRTFVAGRDNRDGRRPILAQRIVEEFAHLPSALADERDDDSVELRSAGEHRQQRGLSDSRACENADPLPKAERSEEIDHAYPGADGRRHAGAAKRRRRIGVERRGPVAVGEFACSVERPAEGVDDSALPGMVRRQRQALGAVGASPDRGVAAGVEGLQGRGGVVDLDDLADLDAAVHVDADATAQSEKARQPRHAIVRHRHLGDDAAHSRGLQIA